MLDRLAPIAHEDKETFCKAVRRLIVDHRTHERRGLAVRFANDQPVSDLLHLAQQCIIEAVLDDQPLGCRTALASRHESGLNTHHRDRKSVVEGKSVAVRTDPGGPLNIKNKKKYTT